MASGMRDLGAFDESSSERPKNEESGVLEALKRIGREGDEKGGVEKEHIEDDTGRGAAFGRSQKAGEFGRRKLAGEEGKVVAGSDDSEVYGTTTDDQRSKTFMEEVPSKYESVRLEDDRGKSEEEDVRQSKPLLSGAQRPPALVLPEGDHGARGGWPPYVAEPREENRGISGSIVSYEELITNAARVARARSASASPQYPKTLFPVPTKCEVVTQTQALENPATESDRSEPRLIHTLTKSFKGVQHTLHVLSQGFKKLLRDRKWARKAHKRRERRRAAKQKEVEDQPQIPVESTPNMLFAGEDGIKVEAGPQPPTEDWAPPTELSQGSGWECYDPIGPVAGNRTSGYPTVAGDQERPRRIEHTHKETQVEEECNVVKSAEIPEGLSGVKCNVFKTEESQEVQKECVDNDTKHRDMMRMYRNARKLAYEIRGPWRPKEKPEKEAK
jgi:hypothetical protein